MITSRSRTRALLVVGLVVATSMTGLAACGDDDAADATPTPASTATGEPDTDATATVDAGGDPTPMQTTPSTGDTGAEPTTPAGEQPTAAPPEPTPAAPGAPESLAVWPARDVVLDTPEEAAAEFVEMVLGVPPVLGEFMQGDSRSGEIDVFSPGEGGADRVLRGTLLLRQLAPDDGWFVLAGVSEFQELVYPTAQETVPHGSVPIEGVGRGFEGTIVLRAFLAGTTTLLDEQIAAGGSLADPAPYLSQLDVSLAEPGDTVMIVAQGGVGLETDPGEFAAIPIVVE